MAILTESIVDLLDRHTAVEHFTRPSKGAAPTALATRNAVSKLHDGFRAAKALPLTATSTPGIRRLKAAYEGDKYWNRVLASRNVDRYPDLAWEELLAVVAEPAFRVSLPAAAEQAWRASPVPQALVYPFGWSGWLSIRVTGTHSLQDLSALVTSLFDARPLHVDGSQRTLGIRELFDEMSTAVRKDVFSNPNLLDRDSSDVMVVTTVLAKHGGSASIRALSTADRDSILKLVRPTGPALTSTTGHVFQTNTQNPLDYIVFDKNGWFIWNEKLLVPENRNRQHLRCYHNNTVRSLAHARHLEGLLRIGVALKKRSASLSEILNTAVQQLGTSKYRNASLLEYVGSESVQKLLTDARQVLQK